ncbi:MAG: peptidase domain-containing ABC transporter [Pseudomonadota bacterium]
MSESTLAPSLNLLDKLNFGFSNKLPLILQAQSAECGLCCLAMISGYFGNYQDLDSLRDRCKISYNGLNLQQMIQIADKLNMSANAIRLELDDLKNLRLPCVLHWDLDHFVVLKAIKRNRIIVHDPARGERSISLSDFSNHFTGVALELIPNINFEKSIVTGKKLALSNFAGKLVGYKASITEVLIISLVLQITSLAFPFYTQIIVDDVLLGNDKDLLVVLAIGFSLVMCFKVFSESIRSLLVLRISTLVNIQMASNVFRHLLRLPLEYFERREMGDIVSRFGSVNKIKEMLTTGVVSGFVDGVMGITVVIMMSIYSIKLTLMVLSFLSLHLFLRLLAYKPLRVRTEESIASHAKKDTNFMESVRAIQSIKIFERESNRSNLWLNRYAMAANRDIAVGKLNVMFGIWQGVIFGIENILIIYLAANQVMENVFTLGLMFAFISYKDQFVQRAISLVEIAVEFKILKLHLARISDIVSSKPECDPDEDKCVVNINGHLVLKDVSFRYSDVDKWIFQNINLEILQGEAVAIMGPSGCGKTTLMKLMMGLLKPNSGDILLDGVSIYRAENYRSHICGVMQNDQLLSGSISDNISFSDNNLDLPRIYQAAKVAAIHQTIMDMPMQYNTVVGDMGASLSGGQKQRIVLARAIYRKPKILFLDEATSHLDSQAESLVNKHIKQLDITRIIIAHRKETIASADRVVDLHSMIGA